MLQVGDELDESSQGVIRWWREWQFWIVTALAATVYFSRIADLPIRGEETRRAMVAREILQTGDWIVPRQQGEPFLSRPPVGSWPIVWLAELTGNLSLVTVRLPTVLATVLTSLLVYVYARRFLSPLGALTSGLAYATFAQVLQLGRVAETEATFTFFFSAALLIWHWGYTAKWPAWRTWCLSYGLLAVATLVKSLQAPVYFGGAVGLFLIWRRDWRYLLSAAHGLGLLVFLGVFAAWQWPFYERLGWQAVRQVWASDVGLRFADVSARTIVMHLLTYPVQVLGCLMPWSLVLPAYLWPQFRRTIGSAAPMVAFLAIAWLVSLPTCWFVPNARPRYLMPLYPLAAPLIGLVVQRVYKAESIKAVRRGWSWLMASAPFAMIGSAIAVAVASWICGVSIPEIAQPPWFAVVYLCVAIAFAALLARNWNRWSPQAATVNVLLLATFLAITVAGVAVNSITAQDPQTRQQVAQFKQRLPAGKPLASFGRIATLFSYYWNEPIKLASPKLPATSHDLPAEAIDYFCFDWSGETPPRLPFPWRVEAVINCDRVIDENPMRCVIIGRRVEAVSLVPDDTQARR